MYSLFSLFDIVVLVIGIMLVAKNYQMGWMNPTVLGGVAFILLALPSVMSMAGM